VFQPAVRLRRARRPASTRTPGSSQGIVFNHKIHIHGRRIRGNNRSRNRGAPMGNVDRRRLHQPDVAVMPPPGYQRDESGGLSRRIAMTLSASGLTNGVRSSSNEDSRRPAADELPVEPDRRVGHRAIDIQEDAPAGIGGRNGEMLPIPADAPPGQLARVARIFLLEGPSMPQSCGRFSVRQLRSSKAGCATATSPRGYHPAGPPSPPRG